MGKFPVLKGVVVLVSLDVAARDLHERQRGAGLLLHRDLPRVHLVPAQSTHSHCPLRPAAATYSTLEVWVNSVVRRQHKDVLKDM